MCVLCVICVALYVSFSPIYFDNIGFVILAQILYYNLRVLID